MKSKIIASAVRYSWPAWSKNGVRVSRGRGLRDPDHHEEHPHHRLRGREDLKPGEPQSRAPIHQERSYLVLQADEPDRDRRGRRRQRRPLHQSFLSPELLHRHQGRRDLDPRGPHDSQGRGAHLRLQHRWRRTHQVPLPPGLSAASLMQVFYLHGFASSAQVDQGRVLRRAASVARHPASLSRFQRAGVFDVDADADARSAGAMPSLPSPPDRSSSSGPAWERSSPSTRRRACPIASID